MKPDKKVICLFFSWTHHVKRLFSEFQSRIRTQWGCSSQDEQKMRNTLMFLWSINNEGLFFWIFSFYPICLFIYLFIYSIFWTNQQISIYLKSAIFEPHSHLVKYWCFGVAADTSHIPKRHYLTIFGKPRASSFNEMEMRPRNQLFLEIAPLKYMEIRWLVQNMKQINLQIGLKIHRFNTSYIYEGTNTKERVIMRNAVIQVLC